MANFQFLYPTEAINYDLNPSGESDGNYSAFASATVSRSTTFARVIGPQSSYSFRVQTAGTNRGITKTVAALPNAITCIAFYIRGTYTAANLRVRVNSVDHTPTLWETYADGWALYRVTISAANSSGQTSYTVFHTTSGADFYLDDMCAQQISADVLPFHGSYNQGDGFGWTDVAHQSTSTMYRTLRDGSSNLFGGQVIDFDDGTYLIVSNILGLGVPPIENQVQQGLEAGATYQSSQLGPRVMTLMSLIKTNAYASGFSALHARRAVIVNYVQPGQPFVFRYHGQGYPQEIVCVYVKGLEGNFQAPPYIEKASITLTAYQPFFRLPTEAVTSLTMATSATLSYTMTKTRGSGWAVNSSGITNVKAIAVSKNNHVFVGGTGGTDNLRGLHNGAWADCGVMTGTKAIYALAFDPAGNTLYVAGAFATIGGVANTVNIAKYVLPTTGVSGGTWSALSTGTNGDVYALCVLSDGTLIASGNFTSPGNYIAKWNGSAWSTLGPNSLSDSSTSSSNGRIQSLDVNAADEVLVAGDFASIGTIGTPASLGVSNSSGSLSSGNWGYKITALTGTGETAATSLVASGTSATGKALTWTATTGATSYNIYREIAAGGGASQMGYITNVLTNSFTDRGQFTQDTNRTPPTSATDGGRSRCIAKYNSTSDYFSYVGTSGLSSGVIYCARFDRDGIRAYFTGDFDAGDGVALNGIGQYNGQVLGAMGAGLNRTAGFGIALAVDPVTGQVWLGGSFSSVNGNTLAVSLASWIPGLSGTGVWQHEDVVLPSSTSVKAFAFDVHKQLWMGFNTSGSGTTSAQTTVTATTTAGGIKAYPRIYITGPGTLRGLDNATTQQQLRFNLPVAADEIATIDFRPGYKTIISTRLNGAVRLRSLVNGAFGQWGLISGANRIRVHFVGTSGSAAVKLADPQLKLTGDS